jgi:Rod binding domain-containing protein
VDTLSESIQKAGGLGLADVIAQSMAMSHPSLKASASAPASQTTFPAPAVPTLKPLK